MPNQKFIEIAQKLRRLERMMGGLARDAEQKALVFDWKGNSDKAVESAKPKDRQLGSFDRPTLARLMLKLRDCRHELVEPELLSNVSWDILLTLFVEGEAGKKALTTKSVCIASKVPQTTGLRWLTMLEEDGLIRRYTVENDQRASMVELTSAGALMMEHYIDSAGSAIYELFVDFQLEREFEKPPV